jgi:cell division protein FtsQ
MTTTKKRPAKSQKKRVAKKPKKRSTSSVAPARKSTRGKPVRKSGAGKRSMATKAASRPKGSTGTRAPSDRLSIGAKNLTARSAALRKIRRQRRRSVVIVLVTITVTALAGLAVLRSPWLAVDGVEVSGTSMVSAGDVLERAAVPLHTPLVDLDVEVIAARVEGMPEVRSAVVRRRLDGIVVIEVTEREPTMALKTSAGFVLVDDDGRQVRTTTVAPDGFLPVIGLEASGVPGDPAPPGSTSVLRLMEHITPQVRAEVSDVIVTGDELALTLTDGGRVLLGDDRELNAKVISLETLLLSVDLRCLHEIDLTVPSAPAISRIGENGNPRDGLADLTQCS